MELSQKPNYTLNSVINSLLYNISKYGLTIKIKSVITNYANIDLQFTILVITILKTQACEKLSNKIIFLTGWTSGKCYWMVP